MRPSLDLPVPPVDAVVMKEVEAVAASVVDLLEALVLPMEEVDARFSFKTSVIRILRLCR